MRVVGALLAAGASRRFGADDKLLADCCGRPLVSWAADALRGAGCNALLAAVSSPRVAAVLPGFTALPVPAGGAMSHSLRAVLLATRQARADAVLICLGDMPNIDAGLLAALIGQGASGACLHAGRPMPPALIAGADIDAALALPPGDHGARALIAAIPASRLIAIGADAARDVDRPGDLIGIG